jgi:hypothetical protein
LFVDAINNSAGSEIGNLFISSINNTNVDVGTGNISRMEAKAALADIKRKSKYFAGFAQRPQVSGQGLRFHSPETA